MDAADLDDQCGLGSFMLRGALGGADRPGVVGRAGHPSAVQAAATGKPAAFWASTQLSYRDVGELLVERGVAVDHVNGLPLGAALHAAAGRCGPALPAYCWGSVAGGRDVREGRTDRAPVGVAVMEKLLPAAWQCTDRYANDQIEADHGRLKVWLRAMRGLKQDCGARMGITGHAFVQNVRRGYCELADAEPANRGLAAALDELAVAICPRRR